MLGLQKTVGAFLVIAGLSIFSKVVIAQEATEPCPCLEERYTSEKAYPLYKQAALDWKAKKWQNAIIKHEQIIEKYPSSPLAAKSHMAIGLFLKYHKLYDRAIPEFQKGISMIPDTRSARDAKTSLACIYGTQGKYDDALNILQEVRSRAKDWDEIKYCSYWTKEVNRLKTRGQSKLKTCGPKALATVLRLKGIKTTSDDSCSLAGQKDGLVSMENLKKAAQAKGLQATGINISLSGLKTVEMPVIAIVRPGHYIVISSVSQTGFTVIDSARGEKPFTMSQTALQKDWTGCVLLFADKPRKTPRYTVLPKDKMANTFGGVCDCCPQQNLGNDSPNVIYDDPPAIFVNTVNLNLIHQGTDLSYAGLGPAVGIKRTYNADDARESTFGRSWTFSYDIYLTEEPTGDVLVHRGSGKVDRFYYIPDYSGPMNGMWNMSLTCVSTTCPDWSTVGQIDTSLLRITQSGNQLTGHLYNLPADMNGTITGNSFTMSGINNGTDEECVFSEQMSVEGIVDANSLTGTVVTNPLPVFPGDPNCQLVIGSGCTEVRSFTAIRRLALASSNYITYEPGVYDTLIKNPDGTWTLKIKKDKTTQHFDSNGRLTSIVDRNGNTLTFGYDGSSKLTTITDAAGRVTAFTYGTNNKITRITDPIGRHADYAYDLNNNLIIATDMGTYTTSYSYDSASYITAIITPKGTTSINFYICSEGYMLQSITDALGNNRWYGTWYSAGEDDTWVTDALGNTTYYNNSDQGDSESVTNPLGNATSFGYDLFGNRTSVANANGNTTNSAYDERGNVTAVTDPLGNVTAFTYDVNDNLIQLKDPLNRIYSYTYDSNNNLTRVTDPLTNQTNFAYDSHGQLIQITDNRGNTTHFVYDSNGNQISSTDPCGHNTTYTYDGVGRLKSRMDAKGNTVSYTYDGLDRITEANYPDGKIRYNYDSSVLTGVTGKDGQPISFQYDSMDRMTRTTYPGGKIIRYGYDGVGNRISITYPNNKTVWYSYDSANRLTRVKDWWNNNTVYTYDAAENLTLTQCLPYGFVTTYAYDNAERLTSLKTTKSNSSVICQYQYTLDAAANRIAVVGNEPIKPNIPYQDIRYTHNQDNQLLTANTTSFQYDNNGNLIAKTEGPNTTTYTYDYDNRLIQLSTGGNTYQYQHDALGNRIAKTKNSVTTKYWVDINRMLPQVLAETDAGGNPLSYYIYGLGLISKIYDIYGEREDSIAYYHYDGLGNTVAITDQAGNIINKYAYTPFGESAGKQETIPNPFRYVGKFGVMDDENGLLYMRARYYDSALARFITKDPLGTSAGLNLYRYCNNNPVSLVDPLGLYTVGDWISDWLAKERRQREIDRIYWDSRTNGAYSRMEQMTNSILQAFSMVNPSTFYISPKDIERYKDLLTPHDKLPDCVKPFYPSPKRQYKNKE